MYDNQIAGRVIFKYKSTPNWITPDSKYDELLVIEGYDSKNYVLVRSDYISKDNDSLEDIHNDLNTCNVIKELTEDQIKKIIEIIENHKELMSVNSYIYLDVCDGSHEEFYFECPSFNRFTEGDCVFSLDTELDNTYYPIDDLDKNRIDAIVVSDDCAVGVESTVVSFAVNPPRLLRPGGITAEQLKKIVPNLVIDPAVLAEPEKNAEVASPGMKYKHYAPKADVTLIEGECDAFIDYCNKNTDIDFALCFDEDLKSLNITASSYGGKNDFLSQAENLFKALRDIDKKGYKRVVVHAPDKREMGLAVYNRLIRAAGFKVISL